MWLVLPLAGLGIVFIVAFPLVLAGFFDDFPRWMEWDSTRWFGWSVYVVILGAAVVQAITYRRRLRLSSNPAISVQAPAPLPRPAVPRYMPVGRASAFWSWFLSIMGTLLAVGLAGEIVSTFAGTEAQSTASTIALALIAVWWFLRWRRGHRPLFRIGYVRASDDIPPTTTQP
jgi:hypothetical protein